MSEKARERRLVEAVRIPAPAGQLEALLETSATADPAQVVVICHPHPLYGGTMHNKVVSHAARALGRADMAVLRFNFRGVGRSTGKYDEGRGEREDSRAALDFLQARFPRAGMALAGFSFGAWVGLAVGCEDRRVTLLIGIGLPVDSTDFSYLVGCTKPKLLVQGTRDEFGSSANLHRLFDELCEPKKLAWIEGADHFFQKELGQLEHTLRDYFAS